MTPRRRGPGSIVFATVLAAYVAAVGCGDGGSSENSCDRAKTIQNQILAERDKDAARGVISHDEPPCNFSDQAKASITGALGPERLKWYADACASYEDAANGCRSPSPLPWAGSP